MSAKRVEKARAVPKRDRPDARVAEAGMKTLNKRIFYAGAALSFLVSLITYLRTVAVSASFWDAGEFIAASYSLGIPHSPGTPLYVLVGRVFSLLPIPGSIALKVNLISVMCGALGALFIYLLVVRFMDLLFGKSKSLIDTSLKVVGALTGAFFVAFSDTYWINATEAEVYAMSCFLMGFMTWLGLKWADDPKGPKSNSLIYLLFYLLALSVGFHLGTILAFTGIFFLIVMTKEKLFSNLEFLLACFGVAMVVADATLYRAGSFTSYLLIIFILALIALYFMDSPFPLACMALFVLGLSVHLFLFIRSAHNPAIDEGNPETWRTLYAVLRREQYPPMNVLQRKASFIFQLEHFNGYFQAQFEMFKMYLGKLSVGSLIPISLGLWGMIDHFSKHKKSFIILFSSFLVTSLGLVIFLNFSDHEVRERDYFYSPAFYYFAAFIGIGASSVLNEVKKLADRVGSGRSVLLGGVASIMVILPFFTLHHHFFAHDRSMNYACRDYAINMLKPLQPNAIIFTNGDNDTFPLWYIQEVEHFRKDVRVVNLSLLNTAWYIKQLRDNQPRVPITWTDEQINHLQPMYSQDGWILVRDLGVQHILREIKWEKPIYFAVTIPTQTFAPYRDYLEMQGLVYRLVPRKGKNMIALDKLTDNIFNQFSYRSILTKDWKRDESIYLASFVKHLIQNYAAAFCHYAYEKRKEKDNKAAIHALEIAQEISPNIDPVVLFLGWYYLEEGDTSKAITHYRKQIKRHPENLELLYRLAGIYERVGDLEKSLELLDVLAQKNPQDKDAVLSGFAISVRLNRVVHARSYLINWLKLHPNDEEVKKMLNELDNATRPRMP